MNLLSTTDYLGQLANNGSLGVLLALAIIAIVILFQKYDNQKDEELDRQEKMIITLTASNSVLEQVLEREKFSATLERKNNDVLDKNQKTETAQEVAGQKAQQTG